MRRTFSATLLFIIALMATAQHSGRSLSREAALKGRDATVEEWRKEQQVLLQDVERDKVCRIGSLSMPFSMQTFGEKPSDGRSLWISLHGGGSAAPSINDGQWENQKHLYQPAEGIYVCPRAPWNDWDMWFKPAIDSLYEQLIRCMVVYHDVNPDKVYLMGYSAGGDGVWRMAPRTADHWAAASMMAGHPGDVDLTGLRNLPFMIWCGSEDAAYNRNRECTQRGLVMDSLRRADSEGYVHSTHIVAGKPHWMDLEDKAALPWMAQYRRQSYPNVIKWCQGDNMRANFYWLTIPNPEEAAKGKMLWASIKDNTISIERCDYSQITINLNDSLVNLDRNIKIVWQGKTLFRGKIPRTEQTLRSTLRASGDPNFCFPASITVKSGE